MSSSQRPLMCFEIEKVIGLSVGNGNVPTYQVQWRPAWVSGHHLTGCEHLIQEFLKKQSEINVTKRVPDSATANARDAAAETSDSTHRDSRQTQWDTVHKDLEIHSNVSTENHENGNSSETAGEIIKSRPISENLVNENSYPSAVNTNYNQNQTTFVSVNLDSAPQSRETLPQSSQPIDSQFVGTDEHNEYKYQAMLEDDDPPDVILLDDNKDDASSTFTYQYTNKNTTTGTVHDDNEENSNPFIKKLPNGKFKCFACPKTVRKQCELTRHVRTHTKEKPFTCHVCGRSFSWRRCLTRHMALHTGDKPFPCDQCDKKFVDRTTLNQHVRTHRAKTEMVMKQAPGDGFL